MATSACLSSKLMLTLDCTAKLSSSSLSFMDHHGYMFFFSCEYRCNCLLRFIVKWTIVHVFLVKSWLSSFHNKCILNQHLFHCNPYGNKCASRHLNQKVMFNTSRDIAFLTLLGPSWSPSWIIKKPPAEITGSFSMLFLMVFGRFPEKIQHSHIFPLRPDYRSNTIRQYCQTSKLLVGLCQT